MLGKVCAAQSSSVFQLGGEICVGWVVEEQASQEVEQFQGADARL